MYENSIIHNGKKETVLLIHGFGAYKENWLRFSRLLKDHYHVIALDLPGHGESAKDAVLNYDYNHQVARVHEFMAKLGINRFHIAGNSMGGAISALYAAQYPEQIITATLIDPAGMHEVRPVLFDYLDRGENPLIVSEKKDIYTLMDFAMANPPFIPWPITEVAALKAMERTELHQKIWMDIRAGFEHTFKAQLQQIQAPTLILWGKQDKVIHYKNADVFAKLITNAQVEVWDDVGHAPMIEVPNRSASRMMQHMGQASVSLSH